MDGELYRIVRAKFLLRGTSLAQWCKERNIRRQWAELVLTEKRKGPAAIELKTRIMKELDIV